MKKRIPSFKELVINNKLQIQEDLRELEKIEVKIEDKHSKKLQLS
ncbi:FbpB family small basic protein [Neobacillus sp. PS3-12]|jgi:hypothetical protein|nr:FbpB family small basic protein [Neobacillus sp. PS3-12]WML52621.1 FbpB family small basic protein [Neobacillus sp. PS3-12]